MVLLSDSAYESRVFIDTQKAFDYSSENNLYYQCLLFVHLFYTFEMVTLYIITMYITMSLNDLILYQRFIYVIFIQRLARM